MSTTKDPLIQSIYSLHNTDLGAPWFLLMDQNLMLWIRPRPHKIVHSLANSPQYHLSFLTGIQTGLCRKLVCTEAVLITAICKRSEVTVCKPETQPRTRVWMETTRDHRSRTALLPHPLSAFCVLTAKVKIMRNYNKKCKSIKYNNRCHPDWNTPRRAGSSGGTWERRDFSSSRRFFTSHTVQSVSESLWVASC